MLGTSGTQDSHTIPHGLHDQESWRGVLRSDQQEYCGRVLSCF